VRIEDDVLIMPDAGSFAANARCAIVLHLEKIMANAAKRPRHK
jgi:hypothetical protein